MVPTPHARPAEHHQGGQALVEFALVVPMIVMLVMGIFDGALMFNAFVGVNRASQNAAHTAATMGNQAGTDCLILSQIETDVMVPNTPNRIIEVVVERTAMGGNQSYAQQRYTRGGSTTCELPDGTSASVPYTLTQAGYPEEQRCPVLDGCLALTPARSTVDNIGVQIRYRHVWATPLNSIYGFFNGGDTGWTFTQRNIFRMEPTR